MKTYILALVALVLAFFNHSKAQEGEKYRMFYPFKVATPQSIQGKYAPYNILYDTSPFGFNTAYIYKKSNQLCMYQPKFLAIDHHGDMWLKVNNQDILFRILYKHMASYFQGRDSGSILCNLYPKLDSKVHEIMFEARINDAKRIPIEAFERLEAEIMLSGVRIDFNKSPGLLNGGDWVSGKFGCLAEQLRDYNKEVEGKHYENLPIVINQKRVDPDRAEIIKKIFRYAYRELWDTAKFRYFTPEIMCCLVFDMAHGTEYLDEEKMYSFYKEGKRANLLLPFEKRVKISYPTETLNYHTKPSVYHILYTSGEYGNMTDAEFATETIIRLIQTYIAYELMIEAYLDPKVKAYLSEQSWFMGSFAKLLRYYAQIKGLDLNKLIKDYHKEVQHIIRTLNLNKDYKPEFLIQEHLLG